MDLLTYIAAMYFVPTLIAMLRGSKTKFSIFILNLLGAWTGLFWLVALVWAISGTTRADEYKVARLNEEATFRALQRYDEQRNGPVVALPQAVPDEGGGFGFVGLMVAVVCVVIMMIAASSIQ